MIEKSKILSIMLISCVISSLFAISFSSTSEDCECDLTEVELSIQTLNSTISDLNSSYNDLLDDYNDVYNLFLDMNSSLNEFGDINQTLIEINNTISILNNSYNVMLENYNELLANFTTYVELLNSFGNITQLILDINLAISGIQANITSIEERLTILESQKITVSPMQTIYTNGYSVSAYGISSMSALHSDTDARIDASFSIFKNGTYQLMITHTSNTNNRNDDGILYVTRFISGMTYIWNIFNASNMDLIHPLLGKVYFSYSSSFTLYEGDVCFISWIKNEDETSGLYYIYGLCLVEV